MGLSGPVRTIACSAQRVGHVCEDCVHADNCALDPGLICTDRHAAFFASELYVWQPACARHSTARAASGPDVTLHVYP